MSDVAPQVRQGTRDPVHGRHATLWWRGVTHETEWRRMARISTTVTTITNTTYNSSRRYQVDQVSLWCLIPDVHLRQDSRGTSPPPVTSSSCNNEGPTATPAALLHPYRLFRSLLQPRRTPAAATHSRSRDTGHTHLLLQPRHTPAVATYSRSRDTGHTHLLLQELHVDWAARHFSPVLLPHLASSPAPQDSCLPNLSRVTPPTLLYLFFTTILHLQ
ncbi:uncharacterized protein [Panulirus ornatus]|uniref:uncharacterized protein isoform X1 n=1 Tax=Panulirus ornatus TaxID=150431 RepID=UPI003A838BD5